MGWFVWMRNAVPDRRANDLTCHATPGWISQLLPSVLEESKSCALLSLDELERAFGSICIKCM